MPIVSDSMVLIHLAKITLLEKTCDLFNKIFVPQVVYRETVVKGKNMDYEDAYLIDQLIKVGKIDVEKISRRDIIRRLNGFNIFGGEAEAVTLYLEKNANLIASDDDNVRKKKQLLKLNLIGTPSIILALFRAGIIDKIKLEDSIDKLRIIGWFSSTVLDKILIEVNKNDRV